VSLQFPVANVQNFVEICKEEVHYFDTLEEYKCAIVQHVSSLIGYRIHGNVG